MAKQEPNPWRLAHMGMEFAIAVLIVAFLGWLFDRSAGTEPWGLVIGAVLGTIGGLYLFIKEALRLNRDE
ncbi:MAG: AtpZ/AtpI family protein [Phycisphaeraceae bacterium]